MVGVEVPLVWPASSVMPMGPALVVDLNQLFQQLVGQFRWQTEQTLVDVLNEVR